MNNESIEIQICYIVRFFPEKTLKDEDEGDILDALSENIKASTDFIDCAGQTFEIMEDVIFDDFCITEKNSVKYYVEILANSDWYYLSDLNNHVIPTLKDVANAILFIESPAMTDKDMLLDIDVSVSHFTLPSHSDPHEGGLEIIYY